MKNLIKLFLQNILGFNNYLFIFSIYKISTLKFDKNEGVFLNLLKLLSEDSVVLDIGANIGIMTVLLAKKCNKGKVFAFEPIEDNFNALQRVLKFFKI
ncbi:MAG: FkbM family methyltransferase, partial [Ignavibacteriaceae bacterium]